MLLSDINVSFKMSTKDFFFFALQTPLCHIQSLNSMAVKIKVNDVNNS